MARLAFRPQPSPDASLGYAVLQALGDPTWVSLKAAIAYVKQSGVKHISGPLNDFLVRHPGGAKFVIGIDQQGSSLEAVEELFLILSDSTSEMFILRNPAGNPSPTFHPKMWYFTNQADDRALLIIGSGNLTGGGLFGNYEATVVAELSREVAEDARVMEDVITTFSEWTAANAPHIVRADLAILQALHDSGELPTETAIRRSLRIARAAAARLGGASLARALSGLFLGKSEPGAPPPPAAAPITARPIVRQPSTSASAPQSAAAAASSGSTVPSPAFVPIHRILYMTVRPQQKTEIFLTKGVLVQDPAFFGAPYSGLTTPKRAQNSPQPQPDPLPVVSLTVYGPGGAVASSASPHSLKMWTYTNGPSANDDFRVTLPAEMLQHVPNDSILVMERDPSGGLDFALSFYPPGHPSYAGLLANCSLPIPNSPRKYGWA